MSEELNEELDSQPVEETLPTETGEDTTSQVSAEELAQKNKELYERAKKAEAKAKELEAKLKPKEDLTTNKSSPNLEERLERQDLRIDGYSGDEVEFLMQNGGRKALDNPIVKEAIEALRKKKKSLEATPSGTAKSAVYQKYSEADLKKMSAEELEKIMR